MNLLVIEDNLESAQWLVRLFTGGGYYVLHKTHVFDALNVAREQRFDAILLDPDLPDVDSSQIALLRSRLKDVPLIAVSTQNDRFGSNKATISGFDAFIGEPWSVPELLDTVEKLVERRSAQSRLNAANQTLSGNPARPKASPALNA